MHVQFQYRTLIILLLLQALPGCTSMLLGNTSTAEPAAGGTGNAAPSAADNAISGSIRRQFSSDAAIRDYAIGIRTISGNVVLTGTVGTYPARDRALLIARNTNGVRNVDNRIVVNTNL